MTKAVFTKTCSALKPIDLRIEELSSRAALLAKDGIDIKWNYCMLHPILSNFCNKWISHYSSPDNSCFWERFLRWRKKQQFFTANHAQSARRKT
ncbi:hypothetical protein [Candidatus Scalindua japonica]|uniref:hypothetical protein n=1 Tax=Candidatus Scalindua japonica TaxID=1284222 RepID=UPI000BDEB38F|nr:hypothetical protein [Candidatus Scalindua japonica]